jgi:putative tricarboxylic transport membrane protein
VNKTFDRFTAITFTIIGVFFMVGSRQITQNSYGSNVGSDIFPFGLGLLFTLLSIRLFYETFRMKDGNKDKVKLQYNKFLIILSATILYALLLEPLGYMISTFLFLIIGFQTMEKGKVWSSVLLSALISAGVYFLYVEIMNGSLPALPEWIVM